MLVTGSGPGTLVSGIVRNPLRSGRIRRQRLASLGVSITGDRSGEHRRECQG